MNALLTTEQIDKLLSLANKGVVTGSLLFGGYSPDSDVDVIIHPDEDVSILTDIDGIVGSLDNETSTLDFVSIKVLIKDVWYNFLLMKSKATYDEFVYATKKIIELKDKYNIDFSSKARRVNVFQTLRLFKNHDVPLY